MKSIIKLSPSKFNLSDQDYLYNQLNSHIITEYSDTLNINFNIIHLNNYYYYIIDLNNYITIGKLQSNGININLNNTF